METNQPKKKPRKHRPPKQFRPSKNAEGATNQSPALNAVQNDNQKVTANNTSLPVKDQLPKPEESSAIFDKNFVRKSRKPRPPKQSQLSKNTEGATNQSPALNTVQNDNQKVTANNTSLPVKDQLPKPEESSNIFDENIARKPRKSRLPKQFQPSKNTEGASNQSPTLNTVKKDNRKATASDVSLPVKDQLVKPEESSTIFDENIVRIVITLPNTKQNNTEANADDEKSASTPFRVLTVTKKDLELFKYHGILPLQETVKKYPDALLQCGQCKAVLKNVAEGHKHLKSKSHLKIIEQHETKQTAALLPKPTEAMFEALDNILNRIISSDDVLNKDDLGTRKQLVVELNAEIQTILPDFSIHLYGSSLTGLGFRSSDINVSLDYENKDTTTAGEALQQILCVLRDSKSLSDIQIDYHTHPEVPTLRFLHKETVFKFSLTVDQGSCETSRLLQQHLLIEPRFYVLAMAFRVLTRSVHLDLPAHALSLLVLCFLQRKDIAPVLHEMTDSKQSPESYLSAADCLEKMNLKSEEEDLETKRLTAGRLWIDLLRFYALNSNAAKDFVTVRHSQKASKAKFQSKKGVLTIEDPFNLKNIICFTQYSAFFLKAYIYFAVPQLENGPLFKQLAKNLAWYLSEDTITVDKATELYRNLTAEQLKWDFNAAVSGKQLNLRCEICKSKDHAKTHCLRLNGPKIIQALERDPEHLKVLDEVCRTIRDIKKPSEKDFEKRELMKSDLQQCLRTKWKDSTLTLFGSSSNGFGFCDSDVDVCLTFDSNPDGKDFNFDRAISNITTILWKGRVFRNVVPIRRAKIPIVKALHLPTKLEIDISLYNMLGISNSRLLATYATVDERVQLLVYMAKVLAKQCEIGYASIGSLSSYAHTVMAIHYLQRTSPPVIPVLQELMPAGTEKVQRVVEGWDTWFFDNIPQLADVWPGYGLNKESASSLWLGYLQYYAQTFDYDHQVISIRRIEPLTKLEKNWGSTPIAIEDPFHLTHNLGKGVKLPMALYIRRIFSKALVLFLTPVTKLPKPFKTLHEYLFDPDNISQEVPPCKGYRWTKKPFLGETNFKNGEKPKKKPSDKKKPQEATKNGKNENKKLKNT